MGNLATTKWVDDTCKVGKNENEQRSTSRNKEWIPWFFFNWGYGSYGINMKKLLGIPSLSYLSWVLWQKPFGASHDLQNNHNMTLVVSPTAQKSYETYKTIVWNKVHCFASVITQIIDILNMEYWMCIYIYIHIYVVYTYVILCILCVYSTDYPFFVKHGPYIENPNIWPTASLFSPTRMLPPLTSRCRIEGFSRVQVVQALQTWINELGLNVGY